MKKKVIIGLCAVLIITLIVIGVIWIIRSRTKEQSEIQAVGYLTYYDQYDPDLQSSFSSAIASMDYDFLLYDCNRSSSIAESNATSAIHSKVKTVWIDYPDEAVSKNVAALLTQAGVTPMIVGPKQEDVSTLSLDTSKAEKDMTSAVKKAVPNAYMMVALFAEEKPTWSKTLTADTAKALATDCHVDPSYVVSSNIQDQQVLAKDYVIDLLTTSHDRSNVIIVCDSAKVAAGIQEAARELQKEDAITIVCYESSEQLHGDTATFVLKKDYTNLKSILKNPKSQTIDFQIEKL